MQLRKWRTNSTELLESIPEDIRETEEVQVITAPETCHKAHRVHWHTAIDNLHVATPILNHLDKPTKRQVMSDVAKTLTSLGGMLQ